MTIEQYVEKWGSSLGPQIGETITMHRGSFGENGRRVRLACFSNGVLLEACGETKWLREI